jgi:tetratricopeptide (TPR) repeat protein
MENNETINNIKQAFELKEQKYYKPAIEMLYKALETENDNIEILYQIGDLYFLMSNYERAQQYIDKALSINSSHEPSLKLSCNIKERLGDLDSALSITQKIFESNPGKNNLYELIKILLIVAAENNRTSEYRVGLQIRREGFRGPASR